MPKRLIDGEALWRSDKLAQVQPLEFRSEYANLIPLAEADGTFEANARRVWTDVYSYNRPDVTPDLVDDMLTEFERAGMITRKTDEEGKIWGKFIGIEARLPAESAQNRYKKGKAHLFNTLSNSLTTQDGLKSNSRVTQDSITLGLDRIGLDSNRSGQSSAVPTFQPGMYPSKGPKHLHKSIVRVWQEVKGISAIARYPSRYPQKWEELCENHSGDLIIPAFELWAREEGIHLQTEYPVVEFLKVAAKYLDRIVPTKQFEKSDPHAALCAAEMEKIQRETAEFLRKEKEEEAFVEATRGMI